MTITELIALVRLKLDDTVEPYRVPDAAIADELNWAQADFARATLAIFLSEDTTTSTAWVSLPERLLFIKTLIIGNAQVRPVGVHELDYGYFTLDGTEAANFSAWRAATGTPKFAVVDLEADRARLVPAPTTETTVTIEGYALPIPMDLDADDSPSIPLGFHQSLATGALASLYASEDVEVVDAGQVQKYQADWQQVLTRGRAQLRTDLRLQIRSMNLPRGFAFDTQQVVGVPNGQPTSS